ncbi:hypothetical protein ElyMa_002878000 [Elysia marginata]|uniref:Uncharacterized protein n=1 Tax=Elysia marginata TaxID=1093978 RepID=A0AAV4I1J0_9GAST|nr:hypothetical protein ElyMa_002878000 [Elysia marginata]
MEAADVQAVLVGSLKDTVMYSRKFVAVLCVVAIATTTTMACSTPLSSDQFRQLYCNSDTVFRGLQVGGSSGLGLDQHGREVTL